MKNLKKVLSLALAFAMVLGLCIGASAAQDVTTLTDWNEVEDKDAATLLNAFNIMQGDDKGTFAPNANVTRAQAAAMISRALWGGKDDVALYNGNNIGGYTDTPAGAWYMGYVNYMTAVKVMAGKGENKFDPEGNVTGYELLKMCLVSLGYSPEAEGLTGAGWDVKAMALATDPNYKNLTTGTKVESWAAPLSRMNAATIIANMIKRTTVYYDLTSGVGGNIVSQVKPNLDSNKKEINFGVKNLNLVDKTAVLVANEYGRLTTKEDKIDKTARGYTGNNALVILENESKTTEVKLNSTFAQLGSPVTMYYREVAPSVNVFVYAAVNDMTEVEPTFNKDTGALTNGEQGKDDDGKTISTVKYYLNGVDVTNKDTELAKIGTWNIVTKTFDIKSDVSVKWYDNNDLGGYIDTVIATKYDKSMDITSTGEHKDDGTVYMTGNTKWDAGKYDKNTLRNATKASDCDFTAETGDKVVYAESKNVFGTTKLHGYVLETVNGEITRKAANNTAIYIDGVKYTCTAAEGAKTSVGAKGDAWFWADGTVHSFKATDTTAKGSNNYALVYDAGKRTDSAALPGEEGSSVVQVAAILPDGTDKIFTVKYFMYTNDKGEVIPTATIDATKADDATLARAATARVDATNDAPAKPAKPAIPAGPFYANTGALTKVKNVVTGGATPAETSDNILVAYSLNDDGTINLYDVGGETTGDYAKKTETAIKDGETVTTGKEPIVTQLTGDKVLYLSKDSVTYMQTSIKTATTAEKWTAVKGTAGASYTVKGGGDNKSCILVSDRYATGDKLGAAYVVLPAGTTTAATTTATFFMVVTEPEVIATTPIAKYEAKIYNGTTDSFSTEQYTGNAGHAGEMYTQFDTTNGFATKITANLENAGFITNFGDGILRIATCNNEQETSSKVWTILPTTKYYKIDGDKTEEVKAADVAAQDKGTVGQYQTIVVPAKDNSNNDTDNAAVVLIFADVKGLDGAVPTIIGNPTALLKTDTFKGLAVSNLTAKIEKQPPNTYKLTLSGTATKLDATNNTGFGETDKAVICLNFGKCAITTEIKDESSTVKGKVDDVNGNCLFIFDPVNGEKTATRTATYTPAGGSEVTVTITIDWTNVKFPTTSR